MRVISIEERRARLAVRHHLSSPADSVTKAAEGLVGFHSSDPATVYLSARARVAEFQIADLESALYEERSLARVLGMRRTMFVIPAHLTATVQCSSTRVMIAREYKRMADMVEKVGIVENGEAWVNDVAARTFAVLRARGQATASELSKDVPELREQIPYYKKDGSLMGKVGVSTRILFLLATEGKIIRGRPKGTWVSSLYRWAPQEDWLGQPTQEIERGEAQTDLLARWLRCFGPASETDIKWWTGWPVTQVRKALERIGAEEVSMDGSPGYIHPEDGETTSPPPNWVALLPSLDSTVMGWKERDWYLGAHSAQLFDRNGNAGPTVWVDGRVAGGWAQTPEGKVIYRLLEDVGKEASDRIGAEAAALTDWLEDTVVKPRFRTPLEKELAAD